MQSIEQSTEQAHASIRDAGATDGVIPAGVGSAATDLVRTGVRSDLLACGSCGHCPLATGRASPIVLNTGLPSLTIAAGAKRPARLPPPLRRRPPQVMPCPTTPSRRALVNSPGWAWAQSGAAVREMQTGAVPIGRRSRNDNRHWMTCERSSYQQAHRQPGGRRPPIHWPAPAKIHSRACRFAPPAFVVLMEAVAGPS